MFVLITFSVFSFYFLGFMFFLTFWGSGVIVHLLISQNAVLDLFGSTVIEHFPISQNDVFRMFDVDGN